MRVFMLINFLLPKNELNQRHMLTMLITMPTMPFSKLMSFVYCWLQIFKQLMFKHMLYWNLF